MSGAPDRVSAGRVGRPHGLDGSFYVTGARPRLLVRGAAVTVDGVTREIVRLAGTQQRPIVRLEGLDDRDAAAVLRGQELSVPVGEAPALGEDEYWAHELEGCEVFAGGSPLGTVRKMIELPSCEALEVVPSESGTGRPGGGSGGGGGSSGDSGRVSGDRSGAALIVPMVKDAILRVDVEARRIEVDVDFLGLGQKQS